jgi:hypothetical protein
MQTWTAACLLAHHLTSAAGRDRAAGSAGPVRSGLDGSSPSCALSRECSRPRCPLISGLAGQDQDRLRLGRQLASWCIISLVLPVETAPTDHQGLSGQAWTAARLAVHRLASAAGRDHTTWSARPIEGYLAARIRVEVHCFASLSATGRDAHSDGTVYIGRPSWPYCEIFNRFLAGICD